MDLKPGTRRLYYEDSYAVDFQACIEAEGKDSRGSYVLLDQTLFFPEGGGQPSDTGYLGDMRVTDVQLVEGEIRHYISGQQNISGEKSPEGKPSGTSLTEDCHPGEKHPEEMLPLISLQPGTKVEGRIDWERRFDLMQQHSGEHIVSGLIHARFGYDNVGFHMGEKFIVIDLNGDISKGQLAELEAEANAYIWTNAEARAFFASEEEIRTLPYRSKLDLEGEVRLQEFPGADLCACCGLHVKRTGEIGLVKLVSVHRFRSGVRIEMVSGKRAMDYLNSHFEQNSQIAVDLSSKPESTLEAVAHLKEENFRLRGEIIRLEKEKKDRIAQRCSGCRDVLVFASDLSPQDIRKCADEILNVVSGRCIVLSGNDQEGYRYAAGCREGDIRGLVKEMNQELSGRGGGKPLFAQGSLGASAAKTEEFFASREYTIIRE